MILRKKLRYVLVETSRPVNMSETSISEELKREMLDFLGQLAYFKANPQVIAQPRNNVFFLGVNRGYERNAILALSFIKRLGGSRIGLYTIRTSGTVRGLRSHLRKTYGR